MSVTAGRCQGEGHGRFYCARPVENSLRYESDGALRTTRGRARSTVSSQQGAGPATRAGGVGGWVGAPRGWSTPSHPGGQDAPRYFRGDRQSSVSSPASYRRIRRVYTKLIRLVSRMYTGDVSVVVKWEAV
jgi:hypothetical protein